MTAESVLETRSRSRGWPRVRFSVNGVMIAAAFVFGVAARYFVARTSLGALDADEAVTGLMARHVLHGEFTAFYWGQNYGGTQEVLLTAAVFRIFGSSIATLRAIPIALFGGSAVTLWFVAKRLFDGRAAAVASALYLIWPAWLVWKSLRAHVFYGVLALLGLSILLLALRAKEHPTWRRHALLGVVVGLGWWATPQIALLAAPCLVWLLFARRSWSMLAFVPAFAVGAAPWFLFNFTHDWASVRALPDQPASTFLSRYVGLWHDTLPSVLGLKIPLLGVWIFRIPVIGIGIYAVLLLGFGYTLFADVRRREAPADSRVLWLICLTYPALYALSPFTWYLGEPRYLFALVPVLCLIVGWKFSQPDRTASIALLVIAAMWTVAALAQMATNNVGTALASGAPVPRDLGPLIHELADDNVRYVYAGYWIAYRIAFESDERILATPTDFIRYAPMDETVRAQQRIAYVFVEGASDDTAFGPGHPEFDRVTAGGFAIYVPNGAG